MKRVGVKVLRGSITRQVDVAVRAAAAVKANLSELRPAFELLAGSQTETVSTQP